MNEDGVMNPLNRQLFFKGFRKRLEQSLSPEKAAAVWEDAGREYGRILSDDPSLKEHKGALTLPAVALYRVLSTKGEDAEGLLCAYGDEMGNRFAKVVRRITGIPGVSKLLWKRIDKTMDRMSAEAKGYKRRIVSEPPEMYGVDILSCPYHEIAKQLGAEKAVLCVCHMDKAYMKGFRRIRYERTTAVSEGAECCDYRLRYDPDKE